jgi:hypothetical protein
MNAAVEACRKEIGSLKGKERGEPSAGPDPGSVSTTPDASREEKVREAVRKVLGIDEPGQQGALKKLSMDLQECGDAAVPPLREVLESGVDKRYSDGFSVSGGLLRIYPNLRSAIVETLAQIGTDDAKRALLQAIGNSKTYHEVLTALFLYIQTSDRDVIRVLAPACLRTLRKMVQGEFGDVGGTCHLFTYYLAIALSTWGLASDEEFMRDLLSIGKLPGVDDGVFTDLLCMAIGHSPREAWDLLNGRSEGPHKTAPAEFVARMSLRSIGTVDLKNYAEFLRLVFSRLDLTVPDRSEIYRSGLFRIEGRLRKTGEDPSGWTTLLDFAKERRGVETDAEIVSLLEHAIGEIERKLK